MSFPSKFIILILAISSYLPLTYAKPAIPSLSSSDRAVVCNETAGDPHHTIPNPNVYGETDIAVIFSAQGCAAVNHGQTFVCSAQFNIAPGQCASYHFKGGTSRRHAAVGLPRNDDINGADNDWNFGTAGNGHFQLNVYNGYKRGVKYMGLYISGLGDTIVFGNVVSA